MTEQDTREKLIEDIMRDSEVTFSTLNGGAPKTVKADYSTVLKWIDRQAAITEREQIDKRIADQIGSVWMKYDIRKLQTERDELKEQIKDYKASMETVEANANLWREQADKLKTENKRLSDRVNGLLLEQLIIAEKLGAENVSNKTA